MPIDSGSPGPWMPVITDAGSDHAHWRVVTQASGDLVCEIYHTDNRGTQDAQLIAAAPDLMAALLALVAACEAGQCEQACAAAYAAIAKAKGEA